MRRRKQRVFIPREREFRRLIRFLKNPNGGLLLLGGDRGSGKTALVREAVQCFPTHERADYSRARRVARKARNLTLARAIKVDIPLIILDTDNTDDKIPVPDMRSKYRSLLMRAMIIGMEADLLKRYNPYYKWLDLPLRWFRSIGYIQRVRSLTPYANYLKLSKNASKSLSLSHGEIGTSLEHALSAEIDLSDSSLEIRLRDLLSQYSSIHKFVFVFDELDKLPPQINLENIALYLKNLFSETGVYGIFVTDESTLRRIITEAEHVPPTELTTLFSDHLLLNNMSPDEFVGAINANVTDIDPERTNQFIAALTLRTHRSPYELSKLYIRYGYAFEDLMTGLQAELGRDKFLRLGVMQLYIDYVRDKFTGTYDTYFERQLNQVLEEVSTILLAQTTQYFEFEWPLSIFYTTQLFRSAGETVEQAQQAELTYKINRKGSPATPEIVQTINNLDIYERKRSLQNAVEMLITLLNRSNMLSVTPQGNDLKIFKIGGINRTNFTYERVEILQFDAIMELIPKEQDTLQTILRYDKAFHAVTDGRRIYDPYHPVEPSEANNIDGDFWGSRFSFSNLNPVWHRMETVAKNSQTNLLHQIWEVVKRQLTESVAQQVTDVRFEHKRITVLFADGQRVQVCALFGGQHAAIDPDAQKAFILRDSSARATNEPRRHAVRNIKLSTGWKNQQSVLRSIATWLNAHVAIIQQPSPTAESET